MGNTTKTLPGTVPPLADQFKARNVTISVAGNEAEVVMYCKRMRLQPRIVKYFETSGVHVFAVAIPYRDGERETCLMPFERVMNQLGAKCEVSCGEIDMICPLPPDTAGVVGLVFERTTNELDKDDCDDPEKNGVMLREVVIDMERRGFKVFRAGNSLNSLPFQLIAWGGSVSVLKVAFMRAVQDHHLPYKLGKLLPQLALC